MSTRLYALSLTAAAVTALPLFALGWVMVVATVNFHDVLWLSCLAAVLYHLHRERRRDRALARELRRQAADRLRDEHLHSAPLFDAWPTGPVFTDEPEPVPWAA